LHCLVNQSARRLRHKKVFARAAWLILPRFSGSGSSIRSVFSPCLHYRKQEAQSLGSAANKLFKHFAAAVAGLFIIGTIAPAGAYYEESLTYQADTGIDTGAYEYTILTDSDGYLTKINPQTGVSDRSSMNDRLIHTVAAGETVSTIAESYGLKSSTVLWENGLSNANSIRSGQKLLIPPVDGITHRVAKGEDVNKVAKAYGIDSEAIIKQNRLTASTLTAGQEIFVPGGKPLVTDAPVRSTPARSGTYSRTTGGAILPRSNSTPVGDKPFIFPTRGKLTQGFHKGHYAYDIGDRSQPPVWAASGGKITKVVNNCDRVSYGCGGGYGNHVIIDHGNGLTTLYAHLEYTSVSVGDQVSQGTVLGKMGRSGNVRGATGIHLHWEVRLNGKKEVPGDYY
jgi:murein DD-endopeptidase MepM/ murein hydrolase activator NlpD